MSRADTHDHPTEPLVVSTARAELVRFFARPADRAVRDRGRPLARQLALAAQSAPRTLLAELPPAPDPATHGLRVATLSVLLGERLGLSPPACAALAYGAMLHDLGKTMLPDDVVARAPSLTEAEREMYAFHPRLTLDLLIAHGPLEPLAQEAVVAHHERLDGHGFPHGLAGDAVPLGGRIVAVADAYDALRRGRGGRPRPSPARVLATLKGTLGGGLDPRVLTILGEWVVDEGVDGPPGAA